jgi:hypothetical protein
MLKPPGEGWSHKHRVFRPLPPLATGACTTRHGRGGDCASDPCPWPPGMTETSSSRGLDSGGACYGLRGVDSGERGSGGGSIRVSVEAHAI